MKDIQILIGWEAGYWVDSLAKTLTLSFTREWFFTFTNWEYENRIRWWHMHSFLRIWDSKLTWFRNTEIDLLLAMDKVSIENHQDKLKSWAIVIYDPKKIRKLDWIREDLNLVPVWMQEIATKVIWMGLARNVVSAWAIFWVLWHDTKEFKKTLTEIFKRKWEEVVSKNHQATDEWVKAVKESWVNLNFDLKPNLDSKRFVMHWNEAIVLWAIKAGCKYLSAYPMTPGSSVMTTMAKEAKNYDVLVSHVEDEIAAVCNVIWAGYAWIRAMTTTSWGWFALMSEAVWFSAMIEAPALIVNAQRPWPSTWLPTMTWQWDLRMAIHQWQWDFPRLVVTPWDHEECVRLTFDTFNLIEKYQIPAIILTEKYLADWYKSIDFIDFEDWSWKIERGEIVKEIKNCHSEALEECSDREQKNSSTSSEWQVGDSEWEVGGSEWQTPYKRFKITKSWISPRVLPWTKNWVYTATSYEHTEEWKAEEKEEEVIAMQEKRLRKIETLKNELPMPELHWEEKAKITLIWWWASKWVILETLILLKEKWVSANFIQFKYICPFKDEIEEMLSSQSNRWKNLISIEANATGQLAWIIREHTWIKIEKQILNISGRPLTASWIVGKIENQKWKN